MVSPSELDKWDASALAKVLAVTAGKHKRLVELGDSLDGIERSLAGWGGQAADAWRAEVGKRRTDITEQQTQVAAVRDALEPVIEDVRRVVEDYKILRSDVAQRGWTIADSGKVSGDVQGSLALETERTRLEDRLKAILERATNVDAEIAAAIRRAVTPTNTPNDPTGTGQPQPPNDGYTPVTAAALMQIVPEISQAKADEIIGPLNDAMRQGGMNTPLRQAAFISQVAVESDRFATTREYADGSEYEGRCRGPNGLGNCSPGDGVKYKGRGYIQLTGRDNYAAASKALGVDLINNPDLAETPEYAFKVSVYYWDTHNGNAVSDTGNIADITQMVNGGDHGLAARTQYFNKGLQVLGK